MAVMVGTVECVHIGDDSAFCRLRDSGGSDETFILWFNVSNPSAFTRVMHSMWVSLLRDAMTQGFSVRVSHATNDARVQTLQVNAPPAP